MAAERMRAAAIGALLLFGCSPERGGELAEVGGSLSMTMGPGAWLGYSHQCLDLPSGSTTSGTPVRLWECDGTTAQQWSLTSNGEIQDASGKCLDIRGGYAEGAKVELWRCNGSASQRFHTTPTWEIRGFDDRCVGPARGRSTSDPLVRMWTCDGSDEQVWRFYPFLFDDDPAGREGRIDAWTDPVDWYTFVAREAGPYVLAIELGTLEDSVLGLYGPSDPDVLLAIDDDSGGHGASRLKARLQAGVYYVRVRAYAASDSGTYTLRLSR